MFSTDDTIVAIATPPGRAGIGVIRLSGPDTTGIASRLLARRSPFEPRRATLTRVRDVGAASTGTIDQVIVTSFPKPASYTGEDVIEISAHGSTLLLQRIVASALRAGARLAQPGEFTLRAFLNGRLDLVQAEAVGDLIDAVTPAQARQAFDQLEGTVTRAMSRIGERIFDLIVRLEASLDFPDEGYHFIVPAEASEAIDDTIADIDALLRAARGGRVIREGRQIAIAGAPNVGKSSLFNALVGMDRAIVTEIAGTTRDLLTERVDIEGVPVTFVDTAGLRDTEEVVEREGVSRARGAAQVADLVLVMLDRSRPLNEADLAFVREALATNGAEDAGGAASRGGRIIVINKSDLPAAWTKDSLEAPESPIIEVSVKTGDGLDALRHAIFTTLVGEERLRDEAGLSNVRHIDLLGRSREALERARENAAVSTPEEIVISDLREAMDALDEITGRRSSEDVLHAIFARFCIGK